MTVNIEKKVKYSEYSNKRTKDIVKLIFGYIFFSEKKTRCENDEDEPFNQNAK